MRKTILMTAGLIVLTAGALARADEKADEKFCSSVAAFDSDLNEVKAIGPHSTVGELRAATDRLDRDVEHLQKAADKMRTPTAKQFTEAVKQLKDDVKNVPDEATLGQVRTKINADIRNADVTGRQLASESGCPQASPHAEPPAPPAPEH